MLKYQRIINLYIATERGFSPARRKRDFNMEEVSEQITKKTLYSAVQPTNALTIGNYIGVRECHIRPDWLLIYKVYEDVLVLQLMRTGSHSKLL